MARFFDLDAANSTTPELRGLLELLRAHREELIELRDAMNARQARLTAARAGGDATGESGPTLPQEEIDRLSGEVRTYVLRMQGLIDQMQAAVARIDELGVVLRNIEMGLVDFPALVNGRQVWLCWRLGEDDVAWWHELTTGFGERRPLVELA